MDDEIRRRITETHRTEMQIIQDAILMRYILSPKASEYLSAFAKERGVSLERALDALFSEMWEHMKGSASRSKTRSTR